MTQPVVYMIAGPNGAGKTTAALKLLPDTLLMREFVNADEIARGLNPLNPEGQPVAAGRLMLERIDQLIGERKNFAFETTGASHVFVDKLTKAKSVGYRSGLIYLWLPNSAIAKERVRLRVAQGGHDIPEDAIERRYKRGLHNLIHLYLPLVDEANIVDSTLPITDAPELIAQRLDAKWVVHKAGAWDEIEKIAKESMHDDAE